MAGTGVGPPAEEETALAAMSTMFETGTTTYNLDPDPDDIGVGAADWSAGEKTLRDYWQNCYDTYLSDLAAVPYYKNTNSISTDDGIDDVCRNVAQRFTSTILDVEGTDQILVPWNLSVEFTGLPPAVPGNEGLLVRILDGLDTPVFEDITGDYLVGDATPIPAAGTTSNPLTQWFGVSQRVSCQTNQAASGAKSGHPMSVYTTGGTDYNAAVLDGYEKVSTHFDIHRIRESDLLEPMPENIYLMLVDLMSPVDSSGNYSPIVPPDTWPIRCNFDQQYVIDGTCVCELDDSCP